MKKNNMDDLTISNEELQEMDTLLGEEAEIASFDGDLEDLIGEDAAELSAILKESEKKAEIFCKKILEKRSIDMNNQNTLIMETNNFSKQELAVIANCYNDIHNSANEQRTLKENLVDYYMSTHPMVTQEDAEKVVESLVAGVNDLTQNFHEAMAEGFDANEHIEDITTEMTLEQRHDFLVTAISLVSTLSAHTLGDTEVEADITATINKMKEKYGEVSEEACDELQNTLATVIKSSPLVLTTESQITEILEVASGDKVEVVDFLSAKYDDIRYKSEMALAAWIEHKRGNLPSLPKDIVPEALAVSIAAGVEQAKIVAEVSNGSKSVEYAVAALKVLGAIALICFLSYIAFLGLGIVLLSFFDAAVLILGSSTFAIFVASAISFLLSIGYCDIAIKVVSKVVEWSCEVFDWTIQALKEDIFPAIKAGFNKLVNWVKGKLSAEQDQDAFA